MKNKLIYILITALSIIIISCSQNGDAASKSKSGGDTSQYLKFNEGIKLAKKEGKSIVIDFYASWCTYCKKMEKETFADSDVLKELKKNFIRIRINTEDPTEVIDFNNSRLSSQQFSGMLGVQGLPTIVFMNKDAQPITKIPGFVSKDVFLPLLKYINEGCYLQNVSFTDYKDGKLNCTAKKK